MRAHWFCRSFVATHPRTGDTAEVVHRRGRVIAIHLQGDDEQWRCLTAAEMAFWLKSLHEPIQS